MGDVVNNYYQLLMDFLKDNFEYALIGFGIFIMFGAFRGWNWMIEMRNTSLIGIRTFIKEMYGDESLWKFQRFITFSSGFILFVVGILFLFINFRNK